MVSKPRLEPTLPIPTTPAEIEMTAAHAFAGLAQLFRTAGPPPEFLYQLHMLAAPSPEFSRRLHVFACESVGIEVPSYLLPDADQSDAIDAPSVPEG